MKNVVIALSFSILTSTCLAIPFLQLDIGGGLYVGGSEESTLTSANEFILYALADSRKGENNLGSNWTDDRFFLSFAITPGLAYQPSGGPDLGSFSINGTVYSATDDMVFGVPPIEDNGEAGKDGGDLGKHDVYKTYFLEQEFQFTGANTSGRYNVAEDTGDVTNYSGSRLFYESWNIDTRNLAEGYNLHFDLYHKNYLSSSDLDVDYKAPFSKDAGTRVLEPPSIALFVLGLIGLGIIRRTEHKD